MTGQTDSNFSTGEYSVANFDLALLRLAKQALLFIYIFVTLFLAVYILAVVRGWSDACDLLGAIFEFIKIGILPLVVLILTFYFQKTASQ